MTSYLRYTHENRPKLAENWKSPPDRILNQKGREVFKMTKNHNFERKISDLGSFDEKPSKNGQKVK